MNRKTTAVFLSMLLSFCLVSITHCFAAEDDRGVLASVLVPDEVAESTGLDIYGWISGGYTWNTSSSDDGFNGPVSFNDRADTLQMDQAYLVLERGLSGEGWDLGGRVDVIYGTDAPYTVSTGFDDQLTGGVADTYELAIPQAYLELAAPVGNGVSVKVGHFYTLLGYEVVTAPDNFFYSHAYSMQYGEPFTHWGALASTDVTEDLSVTAGVVRGWDNLSDSADGNLAFLGGATYALCDKTSVTLSVITGNEGSGTNRTGYSIVLTHQIMDSLEYVFQHDFGIQENDGGVGSDTWYSVNNYLLYQLTEAIGLGTRFEWFRDEGGVRVGGLRSGSGGVPADYYEVTLGGNIDLGHNLMFRPEVRFDYQDTDSSDSVQAFESGTEDFQTTVGDESASVVLVSYEVSSTFWRHL